MSAGVVDAPSRALMKLEELAQALVVLGCPTEKSAEMAGQLDKRAKQLAEQKQQPYEAAVTHLLGLMKQGWAAQQQEFKNRNEGAGTND